MVVLGSSRVCQFGLVEIWLVLPIVWLSPFQLCCSTFGFGSGSPGTWLMDMIASIMVLLNLLVIVLVICSFCALSCVWLICGLICDWLTDWLSVRQPSLTCYTLFEYESWMQHKFFRFAPFYSNASMTPWKILVYWRLCMRCLSVGYLTLDGLSKYTSHGTCRLH